MKLALPCASFRIQAVVYDRFPPSRRCVCAAGGGVARGGAEWGRGRVEGEFPKGAWVRAAGGGEGSKGSKAEAESETGRGGQGSRYSCDLHPPLHRPRLLSPSAAPLPVPAQPRPCPTTKKICDPQVAYNMNISTTALHQRSSTSQQVCGSFKLCGR